MFKVNKSKFSVYSFSKNKVTKDYGKLKQKFNYLTLFNNKSSIKFNHCIFNEYYKWYLNSLFFEKKKIITFKRLFSQNKNLYSSSNNKLK
jgi:hypothetical protein